MLATKQIQRQKPILFTEGDTMKYIMFCWDKMSGNMVDRN